MKLGIYPEGFVKILEDDILTFACRGRDVAYVAIGDVLPNFVSVSIRLSDGKDRIVRCTDREAAGEVVEYVVSKMAEDQK